MDTGNAISVLQNMRSQLQALTHAEEILRLVQGAENRVASLTEKANGLANDVAALAATLDEGNVKVKALNDRYARLGRELADKHEANLKKTRDEVAATRAEAVAAMQGEVKALAVERDELSTTVATLTAERANLEAATHNLQANITALKKSVAAV